MHQYVALEDTVYFGFSANQLTGAGGDGSTPLFDVREAGASSSAAPVLSGTPTLLSSANYLDGSYEVAIAATAANGFAANKTYLVYVTLTIDAVTPGACIGSFRTAPVPSNVTQIGGDAQSATDLKDFADAGYDPSTNKVQGVVLTDTVTTYTGNTPQTGDSFARIGANGAGLTVLATAASLQAVADLVVAVPAAVWAVGTRTLTGFGSLVADVATAVWSAATRTLTAFGFGVTVTANNDKTGYSLLTAPPTANEIADAVLIRDWDDVSGEIPARCLFQAARILRNKVVISDDGTVTVYEEDGATVAWSGTVDTDAEALPITGMVPA